MWNITKLNTMETEIIETPTTEVVKKETTEEAMIKALEAQGLSNDFIAEALKVIVTTAVTQNNQGTVIIDYHARLKAIQTILKVKDKRYDNSWVNLNFFQAPSVKDLKY